MLWPFNHYPGTDYETFNWDWILKTVKHWNEYLTAFFKEPDGKLKTMLTNILMEHPEWVTTVMDGAITAQKLMPSFLQEVLNPFVTPEMFGAVGDGVTDDSSAIQQAINTGKAVYFQSTEYLLNGTIHLEDHTDWTFMAPNTTFIYTGTDYAFRARHLVNCKIFINAITSNTGGGICFYGTDTHVGVDGITRRDWTQYIDFYFNRFYVATTKHCIAVENDGDNWVNEINVYGGRFERGNDAVHMQHDSSQGISHWKFYNVGIEGVSNGFNLRSTTDGFTDFLFVGMRQAEATSLFINDGPCTKFMIIDPDEIATTRWHLTTDADNWMIQYPEYYQYVEHGNFRIYRNKNRIYNLDQGQVVPSGADLEDYVVPGVYTCPDTATAATMSNLPETVAFSMVVRSVNGELHSNDSYNYIIREFSGSGGKQYTQYAESDSAGVWTFDKWMEICKFDNDIEMVPESLLGGVAIPSGADINSPTYTKPGVYVANGTGNSLSNRPSGVGNTFTMIVRSPKGVIESNWNYVTREIYNLGDPNIYRETCSSNGSNTWSYASWYKFTGTAI